MAFVFVQTAVHDNASAVTGTVTAGTAITVNNLVVVNIRNATSLATISSVTDDKGNVYAKAAGPIQAGVNTLYLWQYYGVQLIGGATIITATFNTSIGSRMTIEEFSGNATTNASVFDKVASNNSGSAVTTISTTISPTSAGELIDAGVVTTGGVSGFTSSSGYTLATSTDIAIATEYKLSGTTSETPGMSWTTSAAPVIVAGAYIPSASITAALTGTVTPSTTDANIVAGGQTIILTITGDTWIAAGALSFDLQRQNIINGLTAATSQTLGWNNVVKTVQGVSGVVRTSSTVVTVTLDAEPTYIINATETVTATIPGTALVGGNPIVATPTFSIAPPIASTGATMLMMGI